MRLDVAAGREEDKGARDKRTEEKGKEVSQGLMHDFRKLQGLICKAKFAVDLKP
jgi:hypothetical protein